MYVTLWQQLLPFFATLQELPERHVNHMDERARRREDTKRDIREERGQPSIASQSVECNRNPHPDLAESALRGS